MLKRSIAITAGVLFAVVLLVSPKPAKSQTSANAKGVTIVPPSFELYANPGESVTEKIRVKNNSDASNIY
jgi:hypothetical protein